MVCVLRYDLGMECWADKSDYSAGHAGVGCPGPQTGDLGFTWIDAPYGIHIGDFNDTRLDGTCSRLLGSTHVAVVWHLH